MLVKTIWLYLVLSCLAGSVSADLVGGHDRQRLTLLFLAKLDAYYQDYPLTLSLPSLPISLPSEQLDSAQWLALLTVLSEEGWLTRKQKAQKRIDNQERVLIGQVQIFSRPGASVRLALPLGMVRVIEIDTMQPLPQNNSQPAYALRFAWQLDEAVDWLWAPALDGLSDIIRLRLASRQRQSGTVTAHWHDTDWRFDTPPQLR
ncbi:MULTISPECIES: hypothetical protein [Reinekea]|uniref:hypothetical protein n=1 Tax=Reinekea TaxID=230494 RepID=UPI0023522C5F|nr:MULTISPECIES: hypothetical protein [Reinekea]MDO7636256.1 hypothetical protein [Porticoccaceae bacterium]